MGDRGSGVISLMLMTTSPFILLLDYFLHEFNIVLWTVLYSGQVKQNEELKNSIYWDNKNEMLTFLSGLTR
jgi:hypothetical protein